MSVIGTEIKLNNNAYTKESVSNVGRQTGIFIWQYEVNIY